jgi:hypothetical protein
MPQFLILCTEVNINIIHYYFCEGTSSCNKAVSIVLYNPISNPLVNVGLLGCNVMWTCTDGGSMFPWMLVSTNKPHMALQQRRPSSTSSSLWEHQTLVYVFSASSLFSLLATYSISLSFTVPKEFIHNTCPYHCILNFTHFSCSVYTFIFYLNQHWADL